MASIPSKRRPSDGRESPSSKRNRGSTDDARPRLQTHSSTTPKTSDADCHLRAPGTASSSSNNSSSKYSSNQPQPRPPPIDRRPSASSQQTGSTASSPRLTTAASLAIGPTATTLETSNNGPASLLKKFSESGHRKQIYATQCKTALNEYKAKSDDLNKALKYIQNENIKALKKREVDQAKEAYEKAKDRLLAADEEYNDVANKLSALIATAATPENAAATAKIHKLESELAGLRKSVSTILTSSSDRAREIETNDSYQPNWASDLREQLSRLERRTDVIQDQTLQAIEDRHRKLEGVVTFQEVEIRKLQKQLESAETAASLSLFDPQSLTANQVDQVKELAGEQLVARFRPLLVESAPTMVDAIAKPALETVSKQVEEKLQLMQRATDDSKEWQKAVSEKMKTTQSADSEKLSRSIRSLHDDYENVLGRLVVLEGWQSAQNKEAEKAVSNEGSDQSHRLDDAVRMETKALRDSVSQLQSDAQAQAKQLEEYILANPTESLAVLRQHVTVLQAASQGIDGRTITICSDLIARSQRDYFNRLLALDAAVQKLNAHANTVADVSITGMNDCTTRMEKLEAQISKIGPPEQLEGLALRLASAENSGATVQHLNQQVEASRQFQQALEQRVGKVESQQSTMLNRVSPSPANPGGEGLLSPLDQSSRNKFYDDTLQILRQRVDSVQHQVSNVQTDALANGMLQQLRSLQTSHTLNPELVQRALAEQKQAIQAAHTNLNHLANSITPEQLEARFSETFRRMQSSQVNSHPSAGTIVDQSNPSSTSSTSLEQRLESALSASQDAQTAIRAIRDTNLEPLKDRLNALHTHVHNTHTGNINNLSSRLLDIEALVKSDDARQPTNIMGTEKSQTNAEQQSQMTSLTKRVDDLSSRADLADTQISHVKQQLGFDPLLSVLDMEPKANVKTLRVDFEEGVQELAKKLIELKRLYTGTGRVALTPQDDDATQSVEFGDKEVAGATSKS